MRYQATYFFGNGTSVRTFVEADDIHQAKQIVGSLLKEPTFEAVTGPADSAVIIREKTVTHVMISMVTTDGQEAMSRARVF